MPGSARGSKPGTSRVRPRRILGKIDRALRVDSVVELAGKAAAEITVARQGRLSLTGTCAADLHVESGGQVEIRGTVAGSVVNDGGLVRLYGTVRGDLQARAGSTWLDEDAVVEGDVVGVVQRG